MFERTLVVCRPELPVHTLDKRDASRKTHLSHGYRKALCCGFQLVFTHDHTISFVMEGIMVPDCPCEQSLVLSPVLKEPGQRSSSRVDTPYVRHHLSKGKMETGPV